MTVTGPGQPLYANAPQGSAFALHAMECGNAGGGRCAVSGPVASQLNDPRGTNSVTLLPDEMPVHTHPANVDNVRPSTPEPAGRLPARFQVRNNQAYLSVTDSPAPVMTTLAPTMIAATGASMAHENRQPNLALRFCIALSGNFPSRS